MALIACPDCGTPVSDAAPACPKCARPIVPAAPAAIPTPTGKQGAGCVANGFRVVAVAWLAFGLYTCATAATKNPNDPGTVGGVTVFTAFVFFFPGLAMLAIGEFLARRGR